MNSNTKESDKLANDIMDMEVMLHKLRAEMSKAKEKRKDLPKGTIWNQANKIREQTIQKTGENAIDAKSFKSQAFRSTQGKTSYSRPASGSISNRVSGTISKRNISDIKKSSDIINGSSKHILQPGGNISKTSIMKKANDSNSQAFLSISDFITVQSTTGKNVIQNTPIKMNDTQKDKMNTSQVNKKLENRNKTRETQEKINTQNFEMQDLQESNISNKQYEMHPKPIININSTLDYTTIDPATKFLFLPEENINYNPIDSNILNIVSQKDTKDSLQSIQNKSKENNRLFSGKFNTLSQIAEDSLGIDYTEYEFDEINDNLIQEASHRDNIPISLLDGEYNERENAKDFQEAVLEWRKANDILLNSNVSINQKFTTKQFHSVETGTGTEVIDSSILDGEYNEFANSLAFKEAVEEFRSQLKSNNVQNEVSVRSYAKKPTITTSKMQISQNNQSNSIHLSESNTFGTSLFDGTYDEEANRLAFQDAVLRWRRKNIPNYQESFPKSDISSEISAGDNNPLPKNPKILTPNFEKNLLTCLYPTYFDKISMVIDDSFLL